MRTASNLVVLGILVLGLMAACGCRRDVTDSKKLEGVWVCEFTSPEGGAFKSTTTIADNGDYTCHIFTSARNVAQTAELEGNMCVKKGVLIDVVTKHSNPIAPLPSTNLGKIVRLNKNELVVENEHQARDSVFRRIK